MRNASEQHITSGGLDDFSNQNLLAPFIYWRFGKLSRDLGNLRGMKFLRESKMVTVPPSFAVSTMLRTNSSGSRKFLLAEQCRYGVQHSIQTPQKHALPP